MSQHEPWQSGAASGSPGRRLTAEETGLARGAAQLDPRTQDLASEEGRAAAGRPVLFDMTPARWRGGFKAAQRHSARVRLFRRAAIASVLIAAVLIPAAALLNPLNSLRGNISIGRVALEGTKITLDYPKLSGTQKDGRPFEIKARSGSQDLSRPNIIELLGIESSIGTADSSTTWVSASRGVYDSKLDKLTLEGDVRIKNSGGYDIWLKTARIDFKTGGLVSKSPVKVVLDGGVIAANEVDVTDNGHKVTFGGEVTSTIGADGQEFAELEVQPEHVQ